MVASVTSSLFIDATVIPVLLYSCTAFFSMLSVQLQDALGKSTRFCKKVLRKCYNYEKEYNLNDVNRDRISKLVDKIKSDPSHPLYKCFQLLPSGRRYRLPAMRTSRFRKSLVPVAIRLLNS